MVEAFREQVGLVACHRRLREVWRSIAPNVRTRRTVTFTARLSASDSPRSRAQAVKVSAQGA
jgi:hypothetical protein